MFTCVFVCLFTCIFICSLLPVYLFTSVFVYLPAYLFVHPCVCLLPMYLFVYLCICCLFTCVFVCPNHSSQYPIRPVQVFSVNGQPEYVLRDVCYDDLWDRISFECVT